MDVTHFTGSSTRTEGFLIETTVAGDIHRYRVECRSESVVVPVERYTVDGDTGLVTEREAGVTGAVEEKLRQMGFEVADPE